jgi:ATP-dependent Lon protease
MVAEPQAPASATPAIPDALPVLPLRGGTVIFPLSVAPLTVGQERSVRLVDEVMRKDRLLVVVASKPGAPDMPGPDDLHKVGVVATVHQLVRAADGTLRLLIQGLERVRLLDFTANEPFLIARIEVAPEKTDPSDETEALQRAVVDIFRRLVTLADDLPGELVMAVESLTEPLQIVYHIA